VWRRVESYGDDRRLGLWTVAGDSLFSRRDL
jgi:hypothetical protein